MSDVIVKVNYAGVGELLKSASFPQLAEAAASAVGKQVVSVDEYVGSTRVNVGVVAQ